MYRLFISVKHVIYCIAFFYTIQEGVYVHGLFLDGAGWDRRNMRLCESSLKVLFTQLPVVHIYAINSTAPKDPKLYLVS